jgi:hypothetical protein
MRTSGVSITSGNSDTMNYNLAFDVTRTPKARNVMKWTGLYLRDTFKLVDYLVAPTAGVGFKVIDSDSAKFSGDGGGGVVDLWTGAALTTGEKLVPQLTPTASIKHAATGSGR